MADAMVSAVAERLISLIEEQARYHINLVKGANKEVQRLAVDLQNIRNVLDDAENRRFKDKKIDYWLSRLEETASEMEDILDEWDYALLKERMEERRSDDVVAPAKHKVCSFIPSSSCLCFNKVAVRHNIGTKILSAKAKLDEILKERDQYGLVVSQTTVDPSLESRPVQSISIVDLTKIHGRDTDRDLLVTKLMGNSGSQEDSGFRIVSIVGTGGLGKTTLAQMVYNHSLVEEYFELRIWVCVSDPFDLATIAKGILESIKVGSSPDTNHLDVLFKCVKESISGKRFLLVLDDVWTEESDKWEPLEDSLRFGGVGSKILVTSRSERVVKMMGSRGSDIYRPGLLSDEDCWLLLRRIALSGRNEVEYEDIGKKIAKKCKGLPLAVKTLGSLLLFKSSLEKWSKVLNSEIWQLEEAKVDIFPHLLLSYNELSPMLKRCFSYCAVFPKDKVIGVKELIENWMALGYLGSNVGDTELKGRECFDVLAMRSLFQDFQYSVSGEIQYCKMHDIIHGFAEFLKNRGTAEARGMKKDPICQVCDPLKISVVNEFCTLYCFDGSLPKFCHCLVRLRVLKFRVLESLPQGIETLVHLRRLALDNSIKLSCEDLKTIFQLYHLQSLSLSGCAIEDIPKEIGNLIHLRFLNLSYNSCLKELPMEIGYLIHLRHIILTGNNYLKELTESMCNLQELVNLNNEHCDSLNRIPERLLHAVHVFPGGIGGNKLELLRNLKHRFGPLSLKIRLDGEGDLNELVQGARKAQLRNAIHITDFQIHFKDEMDEEGSSSLSWVWMDLLDALQPHPNLNKLEIWRYGGSKFPQWMISPLNQLKRLHLRYCKHLTLLPPLGILPCLEELLLSHMEALEVVRQEILGIATGGGDVIAFPKLKELSLRYCHKLKEWEDITSEEEESAASSIMPCLTLLKIGDCKALTMLPHRLLRKASSLKTLDIESSTELLRRYCDKNGSGWKSISMNNPNLYLISTDPRTIALNTFTAALRFIQGARQPAEPEDSGDTQKQINN